MIQDRYLLQQMLQVVKNVNTSYPADMELDGRPLLKIAEFIYKQMQLSQGAENHAYAIMPVWEQLYTIAYNDPFYSDKSIATISNHIQQFFQKATNGPGQFSNTKLKSKLTARLKKGR